MCTGLLKIVAGEYIHRGSKVHCCLIDASCINDMFVGELVCIQRGVLTFNSCPNKLVLRTLACTCACASARQLSFLLLSRDIVWSAGWPYLHTQCRTSGVLHLPSTTAASLDGWYSSTVMLDLIFHKTVRYNWIRCVENAYNYDHNDHTAYRITLVMQPLLCQFMSWRNYVKRVNFKYEFTKSWMKHVRTGPKKNKNASGSFRVKFTALAIAASFLKMALLRRRIPSERRALWTSSMGGISWRLVLVLYQELFCCQG